MKRVFLNGSTLILCLFVLACGSSGSKGDGAIPEDLRVVFGEGGGFSGRWNGHSVGTDRKVVRWEGLAVEENMSEVGELTQDECALLWQKVEDSKFFESESREKGNMTRLIRVTANGETHEVTWVAAGLGGGEPNPLDALLAYCRTQVATEASK